MTVDAVTFAAVGAARSKNRGASVLVSVQEEDHKHDEEEDDKDAALTISDTAIPPLS